MTPLELSADEAQTLEQVLHRCLADLELEILHTDHAEFKVLLKQKRAVLQQIAAKISEHRLAAA